MKKINKKLSLCIALALMQSVYSTGAIASIPEGDSDNNSIAIGIGSSSAQESSIAIGKQASVEKTSKSAIAIGEDAKVIMGNNSNGAMNGNGAIAIGSGSTAAGYSSISVGYLAGKGSNGFFNFALGAEADQNISGEENISVGRWANNNTTTSLNIAMGLNALRNSTDLVNAPIVISPYYASGGNLALGNSALMDIHGSSNVALGTRAGLGMKGSGNIIMGTVAGSNAGKNADGTDGTVLSNSIIMGTQAGNNAGGDKNIILGNYMNNAVMANNVVAVGSNSRVTKQFGLGLGHGIINDAQYGLAVGSYNKLSETAKKSGVFGIGNYGKTTLSGAESYVIGNNNEVSTNNTFVLGNNVSTTAANSVNLGSNSESATAISTSTMQINGMLKQFAGTTPVGTVSVGKSGEERTLTNVGAGRINAHSTDGVNGSQLYAVISTLEDINNSSKMKYFGVGTEPTLEDLSKKGIIDYKKASQKSQNNNENGEGAGPNALDKNNYGALAAGMGAFASHGYSTAVGYNATSVISSTSLGAASYATSNSAAVGVNAYATNKGTSVGNNTQSANGVAIGYNATAGDFYKNLPGELFSSYSGTAIGNNAFARGGVAVGDSASAEAYGVALGDRTYVAWRGSALGDNASVLANGGVALGPDAVADTAAGKIGFVATAAGQPATEMELAASIGKADVVNQFNNKWSEKNNEYTEVMKNYYSLHDEAQKNDDILRNTKGSTDAEKQKAYEAALAKKADLSNRILEATKQKNAWLSQNKDFLNALEEKNNALSAWRSSDGAISVGSAAYTDENGKFHAANTRQITNLAAGTEDTDAVNVAQLKSVKNLVDELNTDQTTNNENITKLQGGFTVSNEIGTKTDIRLGGENKTDIKFIGAKDKIDVSVETTAEGAKITIAPNAKLGETLDISNNTSITNLNNRVDNLEVKFGDINDQIAANKVTVEGDSNSGVKVENVAQEGDPVKYKVSLEDKVQVGNVTIEGSIDNGNKIGEITGLTNTTLNSADFATTGRAATEEQLKSVMDTLGTVGSVDLSAGENIQIDKLGNNDYKVSLKDDISLNSIEAKEYKVGNETYIDSNGINANNKTISNVAPGRVDATSTDAVNGSQLYQVKQDIQGLSNDISRFGEEIDSVGALSAAMAGLHPRFQDGNKGELAMAMGSYDGKNALAVGGFYAPNQEVMFSLGMGITQGGKKMGNIGVNFALDRTKKGEVPKRDIIYTRREVDTSLKAQEEKIQLLLMKLEAQSREIETLKAKLQ